MGSRRHSGLCVRGFVFNPATRPLPRCKRRAACPVNSRPSASIFEPRTQAAAELAGVFTGKSRARAAAPVGEPGESVSNFATIWSNFSRSQEGGCKKTRNCLPSAKLPLPAPCHGAKRRMTDDEPARPSPFPVHRPPFYYVSWKIVAAGTLWPTKLFQPSRLRCMGVISSH